MGKKKPADSVTVDISPHELDAIKETLDNHSMVALTDSEGKITWVNDAFCKVSKFSKKELIGKTHRVVKSGFHTEAFYGRLWRTIKAGQVFSADVRDKAKNGRFFWSRSVIMPRRDDSGKIVGYVIIRTPISDLMKDVERQIRDGVESDQIRGLREGWKK